MPHSTPRASCIAGQMVPLVLSAALACGGDLANSDAAILQVADTTVVRSASPRLTGEATLELVTTYARFEGDAGSTLTSVWVHDVGPEGSVYLMDMSAGVKRFEVDGDFGAWVARYGRGPGEVRNGQGLAVRHDGKVAFWDLGNGRIATLGPHGSTTTRVGSRRPQYTEGTLTWVGDTLWAVAASPLAGRGESDGPRLLRFDGSLEIQDSVLVPQRYFERCPTLSESRYRTGYWEDQRDPWLPKVRISIGRDGRIIFACPSDFEFDVVSPNGAVLRIQWDRAPIPIQDSEVWDVSGPVIQVKDQPSHRPAYSRVIPEPSGRTWVWLSQPSVLEAVREEFIPFAGKPEVYRIRSGDGIFDVFDENGAWLGSVRIPPEIRYSGHPTEPAIVIRGDTIWAAFEDEFDVDYVGKYVVRWPEN